MGFVKEIVPAFLRLQITMKVKARSALRDIAKLDLSKSHIHPKSTKPCFNEVHLNLNPVGSWTLHFDWESKGNYHWTPLYFNFDGTFAYLAGANEGKWTQVDDLITWRFKRAPNEENNTVYSGTATKNFMSGIMFSFQGEKGHWYAIKKGTKVFSLKENIKIPYLLDKESRPKFDPIGRKTQ